MISRRRTARRLASTGCLGRLSIVAVLVGLTSPAQAQPTFRTGIDLVHFDIAVTEDRDDTAPLLTVGDFELFEDGQRQDIRYFSRGLESDRETMPLHLGVMFDASGSMERDGSFAKTAAIKFLNALQYAVDMTVVDFDTEVRVARYGQADFPRLVERLRNQRATGYTALYDALGVYLDGAFAQRGRKVMLLYTDGADTSSRMPFDETLDLLKASDVTVYAIGFQKNLPAGSRMLQRLRLEQLVAVTGGRCFFPDSADSLDQIYEQILGELEGRYTLGYVSTNGRTEGRWREVEIRAKDGSGRNLGIRTRGGYFEPWVEP
jgi:Ca-activated chloride channel family protein